MLVQCDASQLEWRTALQLSQDAVGIQEIVEGQDPHNLNQIALALPSRLIAKIFLFRTIFRGSGFSFANDPDFMHVSASSKYWDARNEAFFEKYAGLNKQHYLWKDMVLANKPIVGPLGRQWTITLKVDYKGELRIPWTTLTNYPVQGTGADIMMLVRIMAYKRIKNDPNLRDAVVFVSTVHDSIVVDCPKALVQTLVNLFHSCFADLQKTIWTNFKYNWNVPMDCECKIGMNMKDMEKIKPTKKD